MTTTELLSTASAVIGVAATCIALRAMHVGKAAYELAERSYFTQLRISVKSERNDKGLFLSAPLPEQIVNNLTLYFPRKIGIPAFALAFPDLTLSDIALVPKIRAYFDSRTPPVPGHEVKRNHVPIPVVAEVHGNTKGNVTITTGLYDLYSQYVRTGDGSSSLTILSFVLNNYGLENEDPQVKVDSLLANIEAHDLL